MPNPSERVPPLPGGDGPTLSPGPLTETDMRSVFTAVDIYRTLGRLEHAVEALENAKNSQGEKQTRLAENVDKLELALSTIHRGSDSQGERLAQLEKEFYVGKVLGVIIVAAGILLVTSMYLVGRLATLSPK